MLAMIVAIVGVGELFRDFGLTTASIQARHLSNGQRTNLFWTNSALGLCLGIVVFLSAGLVASFYNEPMLKPLTQVLSITFLFNGISTQFKAHLNRELQLVRLTAGDLIGQIAGLALGLAMALNGFGVWALIGQQVLQSLASLLAMIILARWRPSRISRDTDASIRPFLKFGWNIMGSQLLSYATTNVSSVIIGSQLGAAPLGLYNRAYQLVVLPLQQLNAPASRVALPVLSRLHSEADRYKEFLLAGQSILLHALVLIFAFTCAQAEPLIRLVLGGQWMASAPIFQILAISGVFQAAGYATYWVFVSKGLSGSQLRYALIFRPIAIAMIALGAIWGIYGIAWMYTGSMFVGWIFGLIWISRVSDAPSLSMFANGLRAIVGYGAAGAISFAAASLVDPGSDLQRILVGAATMILALGIVFFAWSAFRRDIMRIVRAAKLLRK